MKRLCIFYLVLIFTLHISETSSWANQSSKEDAIIALLSEARKSKTTEELIDTLHEDENVLKAISLYFRMINRKDMNDDDMAMRLAHLFTTAGWTEWEPAIGIKHIEKTLYLVSIGAAAVTNPSSLYIFYDNAYRRIATGENGLIYVIDFKMVDSEIGVIFNRIPGSTSFRPDFALLRKEKDEWHIKWTPEGQNEWIAVNGEIKFLTDDLSLIKVRGTSFDLRSGIRPNKEEFFIERDFIGIWEKKGDAYVRRSTLPPDAPFYDKLWEMTDISNPLNAAYATVFEFLRRLRNGEDARAAELSMPGIVEKAKELGLTETIDQKGNLVYYSPWKFTIIGNNADPAKLSKSSLHESIQIFFIENSNPLRKLMALFTYLRKQRIRQLLLSAMTDHLQ